MGALRQKRTNLTGPEMLILPRNLAHPCGSQNPVMQPYSKGRTRVYQANCGEGLDIRSATTNGFAKGGLWAANEAAKACFRSLLTADMGKNRVRGPRRKRGGPRFQDYS